MDPADCPRIHELDEEAQKRLAKEYETEQLAFVLKALDSSLATD
jgi:hypothetical protein